MSDIRDFFIKTLDDSSTGIQAMMVRLQARISEVDPEVEKQLARQGIKMQYFAFRWVRLVLLSLILRPLTSDHRWLSLMLSQEFSLPDVLTLWDALLTDESRTSLLINICCSMVYLTRDSILNNDFASNMKLLQVTVNRLFKASFVLKYFL